MLTHSTNATNSDSSGTNHPDNGRLLIELQRARQDHSTKQHHADELAREIAHLEYEIKHGGQELGRHEDELKHMESTLQKDKQSFTAADQLARSTDNELKQKQVDIDKVKRDIDGLQHQIEVKRSEIGRLEEGARHLVKDRQEGRREFELGRFGAQSEEAQIRDRLLHNQQERDAIKRKENELATKQDRATHLHHEINVASQEISKLEQDMRSH